MLLTLSTTGRPSEGLAATELGYLLHKHPDRVQTFDISAGKAHVFYPEATAQRCTAALLLDLDPIALVRRKSGPAGEGFALQQYVNDRPYVASSFLSHALAQVYSSALNGRCHDRPHLVDTPLPLEARLSVVRARGGADALKRLFKPLGYALDITPHPLDPQFPAWGESPYFSVTLRHELPVQTLLSHLYVLMPVLDREKHYWVSAQEVDKLLTKGEGWLATHPERDYITRQYLMKLGGLTRLALSRLLENEAVEEALDGDLLPEAEDVTEPVAPTEPRVSLHQQRLLAAVEQLRRAGVRRVLDLGCGEGKLLQLLLRDGQFEQIVGMDVSYRSLQRAADRLHYDELSPRQRERLQLMQGSLTYRDARLEGFDGAAIVEVIEHLDPARLHAFARVVFEFARPGTVVLTTPNADYNVRYESLTAGTFRHTDHRFEWSRAEFQTWADGIAERFDYTVSLFPVGETDPDVGAPSQMAVFRLA
ncbi:3' terminal RNA ribose 2'-O-methyltransferase Hen1 [Catalinimonas alkaloidigena]|uniref:Small RNA 2'-O-methyltransferase n=1 Tax=Catalinimonas alkaloidigena TaxID=1075417 RepID=A0A1G9T4B6_9BACT|nr:3' terminal RNA ribose 2'-O-methyltransferase Hen1 [Catalinimonas alkaloidigena]SDM42490.1 3' terminal RNA ribose 2'-O-methyltransferase Hen1 [Catalinimonas alkaloidigena]